MGVVILNGVPQLAVLPNQIFHLPLELVDALTLRLDQALLVLYNSGEFLQVQHGFHRIIQQALHIFFLSSTAAEFIGLFRFGFLSSRVVSEALFRLSRLCAARDVWMLSRPSDNAVRRLREWSSRSLSFSLTLSSRIYLSLSISHPPSFLFFPIFFLQNSSPNTLNKNSHLLHFLLFFFKYTLKKLKN